MLSYTDGYSMDGIKNEKALIDILKVVFDEQDEEVIREQHENCINAWNEYKSNAKKKRNYDKKKNNEIKKLKEEIAKLKEEIVNIAKIKNKQIKKEKDVGELEAENKRLNKMLSCLPNDMQDKWWCNRFERWRWDDDGFEYDFDTTDEDEVEVTTDEDDC